MERRYTSRISSIKMAALVVGLLPLASTVAGNFDPTSPDVLHAYEGEATYAKRQTALAGLNSLLGAIGHRQYSDTRSGLIITGPNNPPGIIDYINAPTIPIKSRLFASSDADLGLPGAPVYLNMSELRSMADISTSRAFTIGEDGAVINTNGFTLAISGELVADGYLLKDGDGVLALTGANTWNQTPFLHEGTLRGNTESLQTSIRSWTPDPFYREVLGSCTAIGCPEFVTPHAQPTSSPIVEFNQDFDGTYSESIYGSAQLIKSGTGTVRLTGENNNTGITRIMAGTLALVDAGKIGPGALQIDTGATFDIAAADGSRTLKGLSGSGQIELGAQRLNLNLTDDAVFQGAISGSGGLSIKASKLTLTGANNFTGVVDIDEGATVALANAGTLSPVAKVGVTGTFDISSADGDRQVGNLGGSGDVLMGSNSLILGADNQYGAFSGHITGTGGVTKTGSGTFEMTGQAKYTGTTRIEQGTYSTHAGGLSSTVVNNSLLEIDHSYEGWEKAITAYSGDISGIGKLIKTGNGVLWLRGTNSYTGGTQVDSGALIGNTQSLQGDFINNADLGFYQVEDGIFSGQVQGYGQLLKFGPGKLSLTGANSHTGGTYFNGTLEINQDAALGDSDARLVSANGTLSITDDIRSTRPISLMDGGGTFDTSVYDLELGGNFRGSGTLNKIGAGTLRLTGASRFMGLTEVQEGRLDIEGTTGHPDFIWEIIDNQYHLRLVPNSGNTIHVSPGAELGGSGTIVADIFNQGRIARGAEIGDFSVYGNIEFAPGSSFLVKANAAGAADRILLNSLDSTATLQGGQVDVQAQNGNYKRNTRYTILTAPGGVSGQFAAVTSNQPFLDPQLSYDPQNVFLQLTRNNVDYVNIAGSPTQRATGHALDAMAKNATGDAAIVRDQFDSLTAPEARTALQSIAGTDPSGTSQSTHLQQRALVQTTSSRLAYLDSQDGMTGHTAFATAQQWLSQANRRADSSQMLYAVMNAAKEDSRQSQQHGLWIRGFGGAGSVDGSAGTSDASYDVYGFLTGYDRSQGRITYGILGGYSEGDLSQDRPKSSTATESWQLGGYGRYRSGDLHMDAVLSYSNNDFSTKRTITVGALTRQARANFDGHALNAYLEAAIVNVGLVNIQPYAALQFIRQHWDSYTEKGAGALNLKVSDNNNNSLRSTLGVRSSFSLKTRSERLSTLELKAGWSHEFKDEGSRIAQLAGDTTATRFTITGRALPRDSAVAGISLITTPKDNITLLAELNGEINAEQYNLSAVVGLRYEW